ncbi:MAG: hypothetical protein AB8G17_01490 [Gammaproteobacteria bacterium]
MKYSKIAKFGCSLAASAVALTTLPVLAASNGLCGPDGCTLVISEDNGTSQSRVTYVTDAATPATAQWSIGSNVISAIGGTGWQPIIGDFNNDGLDDLAVYKDGVFIVDWRVHASFQVSFTTYTLPSASQWNANSIPVSGDWDGVGGDDFGIYTDGTFKLFPNRSDLTDMITISFGTLPQIPGYHFNQIPISGNINNARDGIAKVGIFWGNTVQYARATTDSSFQFLDLANSNAVFGTVNRPLMLAHPIIVDTNAWAGKNYEFSFLMPPGPGGTYLNDCGSTGDPAALGFQCRPLVPGSPSTNPPIWVPPTPFD